MSVYDDLRRELATALDQEEATWHTDEAAPATTEQTREEELASYRHMREVEAAHELVFMMNMATGEGGYCACEDDAAWDLVGN